MSKKRIIGVDPGSIISGFGVVDAVDDSVQAIDFGVIKLPEKKPLFERYLNLAQAFEALLDQHKPTIMSIETQFVYKNPHSTIVLVQLRGMFLIAALKRDIKVFEYAPTKAKQSITGYGHATKEQVRHMTLMSLGLQHKDVPTDASDALAMALCHYHQLNLISRGLYHGV